nr:hypothetical protein A132_03630 [Vibrio kanaloae 5S-149]
MVFIATRVIALIAEIINARFTSRHIGLMVVIFFAVSNQLMGRKSHKPCEKNNKYANKENLNPNDRGKADG